MTLTVLRDETLVNNLSKKQLECFKLVTKVLNKNGYEARLVGGAVRDLLTRKEPSDIDVATTAKPDEVTKIFSGYYYKDDFVRVVPTGLSHGTVTLVVDGFPVEVTTLRIDLSTDGRRAEVEFTDDWKKDASRRDFTINAMSMDVDGTVYDYFGGIEDLKNKTVRFVGDPTTRIREDYLRILRYFRFSARIGVDSWIDLPEDLRACFAEVDGLETISGERIWSELTKTFSAPDRSGALGVMWASGILSRCGFGELDPEFVSEAMVLPDEARSSLYYIASLVRSKENLDALRARLKFDSNSYDTVYFLIQRVYEEGIDAIDSEYVREQYARGTSIVMLRHLAVFTDSKDAIDAADEIASNPPAKFPVSGNDLKNIGLSGPDIGKGLSSLRDLWIESGYSATREELLKEVH